MSSVTTPMTSHTTAGPLSYSLDACTPASAVDLPSRFRTHPPLAARFKLADSLQCSAGMYHLDFNDIFGDVFRI
jgi:hypothetical protein